MEENKQHIDELFRESLGNYTETPPPAMWEAIELRLGGEKRRPAGGILRWWGWLALLLTIGGGALVMNQYQKTGGDSVAVNTVSKTALPAPHPASLPVANPAGQSTDENPKPVDQTKKHTATPQENSAAHSHTAGNHSHTARRDHHHRATVAANQPAAQVPTASTTPASARNHRHHNRSNKSVANTPAVIGNVVHQPEPSTVAQLKVVSAARPAAPKRTRTRRQPATATTAGPVSNWQKNQPATVATTPVSTAGTNTSPQNKSRTRMAKRPARNASLNTAAPVVAKPVPETLPNAATNRPRKVTRTQRPKRIVKPATSDKPATSTQPVTVATTTPRSASPKIRSAPKRHRSLASVTTSVPVAAAKPFRQAHPRVTPVVSSSAKATPATSTPSNTAVNGVATTTPGNHQPASLQGKDEDVNFPSTRTPDPAAQPKPVVTAPDVTGNPVTDDDTDSNGDTTPYTMNQHRKHVNGLGFSAGIAAGYSFGLSKPAPNEVVIAPYLQYKLSDRLSLRLTPAYRVGTVSTQQGANGNYFQNSPTTLSQNSFISIDTSHPQPFDTTITRNYFLRQQYDSIRTSGSYGGHSWAVDIPVTLAYRLGAGFTVFGGPAFSYQNTVSFTTSRQTFTVLRSDTITTTTKLNIPPLDTTVLKENFTHEGQPISAYTDQSFSGSAAFRLGYFVGLRYEYRRVQAEFSIQQNLSGISNIANDALRKIYSQPYLRFTIGYSLWEPRRRKVEAPE